jgi:hypothetical protein
MNMRRIIVLFGRCFSILLEIRPYPDDFPIFNLLIICLTSFGEVCFAGRFIGSGIFKKLFLCSDVQGLGLCLGGE